MNKITLTLLLGLLSGCANTVTPNYDEKFGEAVRAAQLKQTINPDAGKTPQDMAGIDGKAARETLLRYQKGFTEPEKVVNVINIGGSVGSK